MPQVLLIEIFELCRREEIADAAVLILAGMVRVIVLEVPNYVLCPLASVWNFCIQLLLGEVEIIEPGLELDGPHRVVVILKDSPNDRIGQGRRRRSATLVLQQPAASSLRNIVESP